MSEASPEKTELSGPDLGRFPRRKAGSGLTGALQPADIIAIALSLVWLVFAGIFLLVFGTGGEGGSLNGIVTLVAIALPLGLIWLAAATSRMARAVRAETQMLQGTIDSLRASIVTQGGALRPSVEKRLDEIASAARQAETAIVSFTSRRDGEAARTKPALIPPEEPGAAADQPALALDTPPEAQAAPVSVPDLIRALNFPDSREDRDGIIALRRALDDRSTAKLIRSAQDVLTLLGQDGIYMDDLRPDRARPEVWRRFAQGERGKAISGLGGVRDRSSLTLATGRMRHDTIFRDAAHHFLRQFDRAFSGFERNASDQELIAMADTRTARAFMLLGRVTGTFD